MKAIIIYRKCNTYKKWSVDMIIPYESNLDMQRAKELVEINKKYEFADLIELKNKIVKVNISIRKNKTRKGGVR